MARSTRQWLRRHPSAWVRFLEGAVRWLNVMLLVAGLLLVAWSGVSYVLLTRHLAPAVGPSPAPAPAPAPEPAAEPALPRSTPAAAPPAAARRVLLAAAVGGSVISGSTAAVGDDDPSGGSGSGSATGATPWFLYAVSAAGAATSGTAATALLGTSLRSVCCVSLNIFLMCCLLTAQACLAVALFVDTSWQRSLPPEGSGQYEWARAFIASRLEVCKWAGVAVFGAQLLTLLLSCALQSAYVAAAEAEEDEEEDVALRGRAPLLPPGMVAGGGAAAGGGGAGAAWVAPPCGSGGPQQQMQEGVWSERMRERYGLDTAALAQAEAQQARRRGCSIM